MASPIEVDALVVRFGDLVAVDRASLRVDAGTITALLGPNGAGKTSLVETLLGFRRPSGGAVRVDGLDPVDRHREVVLRTGALLQRGGVWFPMSPREVLELTATYYPSPRDPAELVDRLGLERCARTPWRRLSGGEQQRTLLALALLGRPGILVLDEPTSAVDPEGHVAVRELLVAERDRGCAILVTTHQLDDAEALADSVSVLDAGRIVAQGSLAELAGPPVVIVETSAPVDPVALAAGLGAPVQVDDAGRLRIAAAATPALHADLAARLAGLGVTVVSLATRASLEETYLALLARSRETRA